MRGKFEVWRAHSATLSQRRPRAEFVISHIEPQTSEFSYLTSNVSITHSPFWRKISPGLSNKEWIGNSLETNGKIGASWFWDRYFSLRCDRQRHQCETKRDLDVSGLEVSHSLSEHPHTLTRSSVHSQNADDSGDDDEIYIMMKRLFVTKYYHFLESPPPSPLSIGSPLSITKTFLCVTINPHIF